MDGSYCLVLGCVHFSDPLQWPYFRNPDYWHPSCCIVNEDQVAKVMKAYCRAYCIDEYSKNTA
jgi:hypothetical protein